MATSKKTAGRTGLPDKISGELRTRISQFLTEKFEDIRADWDNMETKERTQLFTALLKYAVPALQSVEYSNNDTATDDIALRLKELRKEEKP